MTAGPHDNKMHPEDRRNLILFIVLAGLLYFGFEHFVFRPQADALKQQKQVAAQMVDPQVAAAETEHPRAEVLAQSPRVTIDNDALSGSLALRGGRIDDLFLKNYRVTVEPGSDRVELLSPPGTAHARYVEFGWVSDDPSVRVPDKDTLWTVKSGSDVSKDAPVTLRWDNGKGLVFERTLSLDDSFMFQVVQRVENHTKKPVTLHSYGFISERGVPDSAMRRGVVHQGPLGYIGGELVQHRFASMRGSEPDTHDATSGWIGITEKYWMIGLIPSQEDSTTFRFLHSPALTKQGKDKYQVDILGPARTIAPGASAEDDSRVFAGAKLVKQLISYEEKLGIPHFDLAVDFGLYYFMTKPFFHLLHFLHGLVGNFGIAIILFTVMLRIAVFPLANTSFRSFAKMRQVAPRINALRDQYGSDRAKLQAEMVKLYQEEKVNPMAGCLPILIQIPIFFSLYKVLSITIEMRHAPFFGWIKDLSEPDPTTVFNLFGLIPWTPPQPLMIGVWPCMMLITMILQRSMNPPPQDRMQAQIIKIMPWFMTYIMAQFASGLVVYWTFNNIFSMTQQYIIMRSMGIEVKFFQKAEAEKKMEEKVEQGPTIHPEAELVEETVEKALFGEDDADGKKGKDKKN